MVAAEVPVTPPIVEAVTAEPAPPEAPAPRIEQLERIYFDFDSSALDAVDRQILDHDVELLANHIGITVQIEGHCDERGTTDYNLALGDRRAWAAARYLTTLGVAPSRIETISYGEERPVAVGHDEDAWRQNRRIEIRILTRGPADADVRDTLAGRSPGVARRP